MSGKQNHLPYECRANTEQYQKARMIAFVRDGFKCRMGCGETRLHQLRGHHLLPRSEGGTNEPANLLTVCEVCHTAIHAKPGGVEMVREMYGACCVAS